MYFCANYYNIIRITRKRMSLLVQRKFITTSQTDADTIQFRIYRWLGNTLVRWYSCKVYFYRLYCIKCKWSASLALWCLQWLQILFSGCDILDVGLDIVKLETLGYLLLSLNLYVKHSSVHLSHNSPFHFFVFFIFFFRSVSFYIISTGTQGNILTQICMIGKILN